MDNFPKYSRSNRTGSNGVALVKDIISRKLNWFFRENNLQDDFGIDGYIDIIGTEESVTGKSFAIQIKTGSSFFRTQTATGWTFYGDNKHLNYYLNLDIPILIFIVDIEQDLVFWELFSVESISQTKSGWSMLIPKRNQLSADSKDALLEIIGDVIDYMPQIKHHWKLNQEIKKSDVVVLNVSQKEVLNQDTKGFIKLLKQLTINDEMIEKSQGKITFLIDGYNHDSREIYEIPEIRLWAEKVFKDFKYWAYFLSLDKITPQFSGIKLLIACLADSKIVGTNADDTLKDFEIDIDKLIEITEQMFEWLNEFTDKYEISEETNMKISTELTEFIFPQP